MSEAGPSALSIRRIADPSDLARSGFTALYRAAFSEPPYLEHYSPEWVHAHVWDHHSQRGGLFVAESEGRVMGLACASPVLAHSDAPVVNFLRSNAAHFPPLDRTIYMAEMAVAPAARRRGLGAELIRARMRWAQAAGFSHYIIRTSLRGSLSAGLYTRAGARRAPVIQDLAGGAVASASNRRQFLFGEIGAWLRRQ